ncbi:MAG TPA: DNRLRE domain-containing protein, partial [Myxococcaceae bacterium]
MSANPWRAAVILGAALALPAAAQPVPLRVELQNGQSPYARYDGATDITITVQDDPDKDPNQNYASRPDLASDGFSARNASLMRFPMDGGAIPAGAIIQGAELQLFVRNETFTGSSAYEVLRPWGEGEATYLRPMAGQTWAGEGASEVGVDRGAAPFISFRQLDAGFYNTLAVSDAGVDLVRRWYSGASPNYGLILQDYDSWDKVAVESSETSNPPKLKVIYLTGTSTTFAMVPASEDTMITYQPPNYEGWGLGFSGRAGGSTSSLFRWDLRAIPPDALVIDAG